MLRLNGVCRFNGEIAGGCWDSRQAALAIARVREDGAKTSAVVVGVERRTKCNNYLGGKIIQM